jgi:hypothetical protein
MRIFSRRKMGLPLLGLLLGFAKNLSAQRLGDLSDPSSAIIGNVLGPDGTPVSADITVYRIAIANGIAKRTVSCATQTKADGTYECSSRSPGRYLVFASPKQKRKSSQSTLLAPMLFSNTTSVDQATAMVLQANDRQSANFFLQASNVSTLRLLLKDKPKGARVVLSLPGETFDVEEPFPARYDPDSGVITISAVPDGQYRISAFWPSGAKEIKASALIQVGPAPQKDIVLSAESVGSITGTLTFQNEAGKSLPQEILLEKMPLSESLEFREKLKSDGSFTFTGIPSGTYCVQVPEVNGAYVHNLVVQGKTVDGSVFSILDGQTNTRLNVLLSSDVGSISGTVDHEVADGIDKKFVLMLSAESKLVSLIPINKDGQFNAPSQAPGEYTLFFWPDLNVLEYRTTKFLTAHSRQGTDVTVEAGLPTTAVELPTLDSKR